MPGREYFAFGVVPQTEVEVISLLNHVFLIFGV